MTSALRSMLEPGRTARTGSAPPGLRLRLVAAGVVVAATAGVAALWGSGSAPEPMVEVVAAEQRWPVGSEPGGFVIVKVPESLAGFFVSVAELQDQVVAEPVPAGSLVSAGQLSSEPLAASEPGAVLLSVPVDVSLWPAPGPVAGQRAVLSHTRAGCAVAVLVVAALAEGAMVLELDPATAGELSAGGDVLWAWPAPLDGWPACPSSETGAASEPGAVLLSVPVDVSLWPAPGPVAGQRAVLSHTRAGCAVAVLVVAALAEGAMALELDPATAGELFAGVDVLWAWPAPLDGWPACPSSETGAATVRVADLTQGVVP